MFSNIPCACSRLLTVLLLALALISQLAVAQRTDSTSAAARKSARKLARTGQPPHVKPGSGTTTVVGEDYQWKGKARFGQNGDWLPVTQWQTKAEKKLVLKSRSYVQYGDYYSAQRTLGQALDINPQNPLTNYWYGKTLMLADRYLQAQPHLLRVWAADTGYAWDIPLLLARCHHRYYRPDSAERFYRQALLRLVRGTAEYQQVLDNIQQCATLRRLANDSVYYYQVRTLGEPVNGPFPDYSALLHPHDQQLFFTSRRIENAGGFYIDDISYDDVYMADGTPEKGFGKALRLGRPINKSWNDATVTFDTSGTRLYVYRDHQRGAVSIFRYKGDRKFDRHRKLKGSIRSGYREPSICFHPTDSIVVFSSTRPGGQGGLDLYMARGTDTGALGEAVNLGDMVNSEWDDDGPFFHPDGSKLYFASPRPTGFGGFDIYEVPWRSGGPAGPAVLMPRPVNSPDHDAFFHHFPADTNKALISSARAGGMGFMDIYWIDMTRPQPRPVAANTGKVQLTLYVIDDSTGVPVSGRVRVYPYKVVGDRTIGGSTDEEGRFVTSIRENNTVLVKVEAEGYPVVTREVTADTGQAHAIVTVPRLRVGSSFTIRNLEFETGTTTLTQRGLIGMDELAALLADNPTLEIRIEGHTDDVGDDDFNMRLSVARAKAILVQLVLYRGIAGTRLQFAGFGETRPIAPNTDDNGRQHNRRIEARFLKL